MHTGVLAFWYACPLVGFAAITGLPRLPVCPLVGNATLLLSWSIHKTLELGFLCLA